MTWPRVWGGALGAAMLVVALAQPAGADDSYVVRPGDTLSAIAARYGVTVANLAAANGIENVHLVVAGRRLAIPARTVAPVVKAVTVTPTTSVRYTVRAGDTFWDIARRFAITPRALAQANGLTVTSTIVPGRVLTVPSVTLPPGLPANLPADLRANPDRLLLYPALVTAARQAGVPADLFMATAYVESGWKQAAISPTGAVGVGQLLPDTSQWVAVVLLHDARLDPANTRDNIRMSARFLRYVLDTTAGDLRRALASYYQGPGSVTRDGITPIGLAYANRIIAARPSFA